jgi:hypothetical protein
VLKKLIRGYLHIKKKKLIKNLIFFFFIPPQIHFWREPWLTLAMICDIWTIIHDNRRWFGIGNSFINMLNWSTFRLGSLTAAKKTNCLCFHAKFVNIHCKVQTLFHGTNSLFI